MQKKKNTDIVWCHYGDSGVTKKENPRVVLEIKKTIKIIKQ